MVGAVEEEGGQQKSIVQQITQEGNDLFKRIIAPVQLQGGSHCHRCPLKDYTWWISSGHGDVNNKKKQCNKWHAACGDQYDWRNPIRVLVIQGSGDLQLEVTVRWKCWLNTSKKRSRLEKMEELRRFITMDNHEAVKNGNLEKTQDLLPVVKPKFTTDFPEVVVR